ncbi:MAG: PmoA family protein [Planctomycetaceae bacterium]|nr:PmoA family protein [Planctomycetaceae bacterium]
MIQQKPILFWAVFFLSAAAQASELTLKKTESGYDVFVGSGLFAGYHTSFEGSPVVYPLIGPAGQKMTRDYPMLKDGGNSTTSDHPHHRSMWFTHGLVNGLDFWTSDAKTGRTAYQIVHKRFVKAESSGTAAVIVTENHWIGKENQLLCRDERMLTFSEWKQCRIIDFDMTVTAEADSVTFGDTKEGTFGIRLADSMTAAGKNGHIINAEGKKEGEAWGKRSAWVDCFGLIDGQTAGIAVLNHPSSFRFPVYWHVREYGLLAANPFGIHEFEKKRNEKHLGDFTLQKGKAFTFRCRILLHQGTPEEAGIAEAFQEYKNKK